MPFFPNPVFGWGFVGVLIAFLAVASYVDLRALIVPKWLTLPLAGLGLVANALRAAWLGAMGNQVWRLGDKGLWIGAVDGILFALAGFALGFALYFLMWILGVVGG